MCAIKPTHKKRIILDVYTSEKITEKEFLDAVFNAVMDLEVKLNESGKLRWHVKETNQKAD